MITLSNGHQYVFGAASGSLAFNGQGWWFDKPFLWTKLLDPSAFTVISKTLTLQPRKGNYIPWMPWKCIRYLGHGNWINAVGLTNPGLATWLKQPHLPLIVSIAPESINETIEMCSRLNDHDVLGIQLNLSCPNAINGEIQKITETAASNTKHPLLLKLGIHVPYLEIAKDTEGIIEALELINAVPWGMIYTNESPLNHYGLKGALSGPCIKPFAQAALQVVKQAGITTPIIAGGGIDGADEINLRKSYGADAVNFGTAFTLSPWLPNQIVKKITS